MWVGVGVAKTRNILSLYNSNFHDYAWRRKVFVQWHTSLNSNKNVKIVLQLSLSWHWLATLTAASSLVSPGNIDTETELETIFSWDSCVLHNISIRNIKLGESQSLCCNVISSIFIFKNSLLMLHPCSTHNMRRWEWGRFPTLSLSRIVWSLSHLLKFPFNLLLTRFWHFCM